MLTDDQLSELRSAAIPTDRVEVCLATTTPAQPLEEQLGRVVEALADAVPGLAVERRPDDGLLPYLEIRVAGAGRVRWSALPTDNEWQPFLRTLQAPEMPKSNAPADDMTAGQTDEPREISVYVAAACPHCALVVGLATELALERSDLRVWIIDAAVFPAAAAALGIRSTPTVVMNGLIRWVGKANAADLLGLLGPDSWEATVGSLAEMGDVDALAQTARQDPAAAPAIARLLATDELAHRMTALRVLEEAAAADPDLARHFLSPLGELASSGDARLRGDVAYGLGLLGLNAAAGPLRELLADPDPEVRETAEEALGELPGEDLDPAR